MKSYVSGISFWNWIKSERSTVVIQLGLYKLREWIIVLIQASPKKIPNRKCFLIFSSPLEIHNSFKINKYNLLCGSWNHFTLENHWIKTETNYAVRMVFKVSNLSKVVGCKNQAPTWSLLTPFSFLFFINFASNPPSNLTKSIEEQLSLWNYAFWISRVEIRAWELPKLEKIMLEVWLTLEST